MHNDNTGKQFERFRRSRIPNLNEDEDADSDDEKESKIESQSGSGSAMFDKTAAESGDAEISFSGENDDNDNKRSDIQTPNENDSIAKAINPAAPAQSNPTDLKVPDTRSGQVENATEFQWTTKENSAAADNTTSTPQQSNTSNATQGSKTPDSASTAAANQTVNNADSKPQEGNATNAASPANNTDATVSKPSQESPETNQNPLASNNGTVSAVESNAPIAQSQAPAPDNAANLQATVANATTNQATGKSDMVMFTERPLQQNYSTVLSEKSTSATPTATYIGKANETTPVQNATVALKPEQVAATKRENIKNIKNDELMTAEELVEDMDSEKDEDKEDVSGSGSGSGSGSFIVREHVTAKKIDTSSKTEQKTSATRLSANEAAFVSTMNEAEKDDGSASGQSSSDLEVTKGSGSGSGEDLENAISSEINQKKIASIDEKNAKNKGKDEDNEDDEEEEEETKSPNKKLQSEKKIQKVEKATKITDNKNKPVYQQITQTQNQYPYAAGQPSTSVSYQTNASISSPQKNKNKAANTQQQVKNSGNDKAIKNAAVQQTYIYTTAQPGQAAKPSPAPQKATGKKASKAKGNKPVKTGQFVQSTLAANQVTAKAVGNMKGNTQQANAAQVAQSAVPASQVTGKAATNIKGSAAAKAGQVAQSAIPVNTAKATGASNNGVKSKAASQNQIKNKGTKKATLKQKSNSSLKASEELGEAADLLKTSSKIELKENEENLPGGTGDDITEEDLQKLQSISVKSSASNENDLGDLMSSLAAKQTETVSKKSEQPKAENASRKSDEPKVEVATAKTAIPKEGNDGKAKSWTMIFNGTENESNLPGGYGGDDFDETSGDSGSGSDDHKDIEMEVESSIGSSFESTLKNSKRGHGSGSGSGSGDDFTTELLPGDYGSESPLSINEEGDSGDEESGESLDFMSGNSGSGRSDIDDHVHALLQAHVNAPGKSKVNIPEQIVIMNKTVHAEPAQVIKQQQQLQQQQQQPKDYPSIQREIVTKVKQSPVLDTNEDDDEYSGASGSAEGSGSFKFDGSGSDSSFALPFTQPEASKPHPGMLAQKGSDLEASNVQQNSEADSAAAQINKTVKQAPQVATAMAPNIMAPNIRPFHSNITLEAPQADTRTDIKDQTSSETSDEETSAEADNSEYDGSGSGASGAGIETNKDEENKKVTEKEETKAKYAEPNKQTKEDDDDNDDDDDDNEVGTKQDEKSAKQHTETKEVSSESQQV